MSISGFRSFLVLVLLSLLAGGAQAQERSEWRLPSPATDIQTFTPLETVAHLEQYVGAMGEEVRADFGSPSKTTVEREGIDEREATLWYYEWFTGDAKRAHLRFALQDGRVVGVEALTTEDEEVLYAAGRYYVATGGSDWTRAGNPPETWWDMYAARRGDTMWQIHFTPTPAGRAGVLRIGTVKYATCDFVWDVEGLRGTDGFGNDLDSEQPPE